MKGFLGKPQAQNGKGKDAAEGKFPQFDATPKSDGALPRKEKRFKSFTVTLLFSSNFYLIVKACIIRPAQEG